MELINYECLINGGSFSLMTTMRSKISVAKQKQLQPFFSFLPWFLSELLPLLSKSYLTLGESSFSH